MQQYMVNLWSFLQTWRNKTRAQQSSTRKAGFLNSTISRNQTYPETYSHNHILTRIRNQTHTTILLIFTHFHTYTLSHQAHIYIHIHTPS